MATLVRICILVPLLASVFARAVKEDEGPWGNANEANAKDLRTQLSDPLFLKQLYDDVERHADDDANLKKELENVLNRLATSAEFEDDKRLGDQSGRTFLDYAPNWLYLNKLLRPKTPYRYQFSPFHPKRSRPYYRSRLYYPSVLKKSDPFNLDEESDLEE